MISGSLHDLDCPGPMRCSCNPLPIRVPVIHMCPPEGSGIMPCCGQTPFEANRRDRMTLDPLAVTCR